MHAVKYVEQFYESCARKLLEQLHLPVPVNYMALLVRIMANKKKISKIV